MDGLIACLWFVYTIIKDNANLGSIFGHPRFCTYYWKTCLCICEINQLCGSRSADQPLSFRYIDSSIPFFLNLKF